MKSYWTLTNGSNVEKSFADWGFGNLQIDIQTLGMDTAKFRVTDTYVDATQPLAFREQIVIRSGRVLNNDGVTYSDGVLAQCGMDGKIRFQGLVTDVPRMGSGEAENLDYVISGPWWYFEKQTFRITYQRVVSIDSSGNKTYAQANTAHFILNVNIFGFPLCTGQTIQTAVQYAITLGAPIQILPNVSVTVPVFADNGGSVSVSASIMSYVYVASDEVNSITIAEAIRRVCRWTPDAVTWFDYTQIPPVFYCQRATGQIGGLDGGGDVPPLTPANVTAFDGGGGTDLLNTSNPYNVKKCDFRERNDLLVPYVNFTFEQVNQIDNQAWFTNSNQLYPPDPPTGLAAFGNLDCTVTLNGIQITTTHAKMATRALPSFSDPTSSDVLAFLISRAGWLGDTKTIAAVTVSAVNNKSGNAYTPSHKFVLTQGQLAAWMKAPPQNSNAIGTGNPVQSAHDALIFTIDVQSTNGTQTRLQKVQVEIVVCDINTFGNLVTFEYDQGYPTPEIPPPNIAQDMYNALNVLQWDGELSVKQNEADFPVSVGNALNITDSPQFANMAATVFNVKIDVDNGITTVKTGPNKRLTLGELIDLMRVVRVRLMLMPPTQLSDGSLS